MEFEAVLLDAHRGRANQLWIHARIKACVLPTDCEPVSAEVRPAYSRQITEVVLPAVQKVSHVSCIWRATCDCRSSASRWSKKRVEKTVVFYALYAGRDV